MSQTPLTLKIDADVKQQAQAVAKTLGLSLSAIVENKLREVIRDRRVIFADPNLPTLEPTPYLEKVIEEFEADLKAGKDFGPELTTPEAVEAYFKSL